MNTFPGTNVSPVDPTTSDSTCAFTNLQHKELSILYIWLAKLESHHSFVSTCLRQHCTPRGLCIKLRPSVPKAPHQEYATRLQREWRNIIQWASIDFLVVLKRYHRNCIEHLKHQATRLEKSMVSSSRRGNSIVQMDSVKATYNK